MIHSVIDSLETSGCNFCTTCVAVCPTGALVDKAVEPATREDDIVPCKAACPVHIDGMLFARGKPDPHLGRDEGFASQVRQAVPELDVEKRAAGFREIATGYNDDQAQKEAKRCLQCDLRL